MDFVFAMFLAIAFPSSGLSRGLEAIMRHASYYCNTGNDIAKNDLQTGVRAVLSVSVFGYMYWGGRLDWVTGRVESGYDSPQPYPRVLGLWQGPTS
jgi:hypothetical protein